jgi:methionine-rich copper-binding protein CopC
MKKIVFCLLATCLSLTFLPLQSSAATTAVPSSTTATTSTGSAEAKNLELRLNEIKAMNKSTLAPSDKKNLRKEVKSINHKLRDISGGVYLSVGAVLLIALLLIILL